MPLGDKILQHNLDPLPVDVGRHDWNTQITRTIFQSARIENIGRHHAGNDETETARHAERR